MCNFDPKVQEAGTISKDALTEKSNQRGSEVMGPKRLEVLKRDWQQLPALDRGVALKALSAQEYTQRACA